MGRGLRPPPRCFLGYTTLSFHLQRCPLPRILLIHWNADEAKKRAARLRGLGYSVTPHSYPEELRQLRGKPPDLFVIDLDRIPSQGRAVGIWLRQRKSTRLVPLLFVGGSPEKVSATRQLIPDAAYSSWRGVQGALHKAMRERPEKPLVPGSMAGYSGTPLPRKLGIKAGATVALLDAPSGFERKLAPLPAGVRLRKQARGKAQLIVLFSQTRAGLRRRFPAARRALAEGGALWIAWPKKASRAPTDLTQSTIRKTGLDAGLVDYKIAAIDETWSGLCFARRRSR